MEVDDGLILLNENIVKLNDYLQTGLDLFFLDDDDDDEYNDDDGRPKIQANTAIMAAELSNHVNLNFSDNVVLAPVMYGGQARDGSVVTVPSMQVWT